MPPICPYCKVTSKLVTGAVIYPHRPDLAAKLFYQCAPCDAWVGCHKGTKTAMGRLANLELRQWKMRVHSVFDPYWRGTKNVTRGMVYRRLARGLNIPLDECHIGMFDVPRCMQALEVISTWGAPPTARYNDFPLVEP